MSRQPSRVVIENVSPEIDAGAFAIKRSPGDLVVVRAAIFADASDTLGARLLYRRAKDSAWLEAPMAPINPGLDLWEGRFQVQELGRYEYTVEGWIDRFATWAKALRKKVEARQNVASELLEGAELLTHTAARTKGKIRDWLKSQAAKIASTKLSQDERAAAALDPELAFSMVQNAERESLLQYRILPVIVEPLRARFGSWYEMFPRSASPDPKRSGRFSDVEAKLPELARMGVDILYLPPIHPIGTTHRKGKNNTPVAGPDDPGSPWGIGSPAGGHDAIEPSLGTLTDFDHLVAAAKVHEIQIALDLALQCSPDHPWVKEHPEWFRHRPDGTIKYAENPPKKYEDIYPINFESKAWEPLWNEIKRVVLFWVSHGVTVFRVDNPHTKPFRFWEWLIHEVKAEHPEVFFLSEAFTRPPVKQYLAKVGFAQSYTYFTWRNTKAELTEYLTELTQTDVRDYLRPNFFANTPDILHHYLQKGGRSAFMIRLILAGTLASSYGIYGPPYELCEADAFPNTEDYVNSEKYEVRHWDWNRPGNIKDLVARVNRIRRENPALQRNEGLRFFSVDNDRLIAYGKRTDDGSNFVLSVVNLDPFQAQAGIVQLPAAELGLFGSYEVHDLLTDNRYTWRGESNFVRLDPQMPAHIFKVRHG